MSLDNIRQGWRLRDTHEVGSGDHVGQWIIVGGWRSWFGTITVEEPTLTWKHLLHFFLSLSATSIALALNAAADNQARIDRGGGYKTTKNNHSVYVHPSSCIIGMQPPPRFILYYELVLTSKEYMRQCMPIEGSWLAERESPFSLLSLKDDADTTVAPHVFKKSEIEAMMGSASKVKMPKEREQPRVGPVAT
jgi:hypothetical protein